MRHKMKQSVTFLDVISNSAATFQNNFSDFSILSVAQKGIDFNSVELTTKPGNLHFYFSHFCIFSKRTIISRLLSMFKTGRLTNFLCVLQDSPDGNVTTSTLSFVATRQDNGRTLTCRASNHLVQNGVEEATVKLNVFCKFLW